MVRAGTPFVLTRVVVGAPLATLANWLACLVGALILLAAALGLAILIAIILIAIIGISITLGKGNSAADQGHRHDGGHHCVIFHIELLSVKNGRMGRPAIVG
jgi:hypothetical protein